MKLTPGGCEITSGLGSDVMGAGDCTAPASSTTGLSDATSPVVFEVDDSTLPLPELVADVSGFEELK